MTHIVLTGAASGIGRTTASELERLGARLTLVDRDAQGLEETTQQFHRSDVHLEVVDLASMGAVRDLALRLSDQPIDVLINNAGLLSERHTFTQDGFELTFAVNALAPFMLTRMLWPQLIRSGSGRVVNISSLSYRHGKIDFEDLSGQCSFSRYGAYARSKLAVLLLTRAMARRAQGSLLINAVHPGVVGSGLGEGGLISRMMKMARPLLKTPEQGARGLVYLATDPSVTDQGAYFVGTRPVRPTARGRDDETGERLHAAVEQLLTPWLVADKAT